MRLRLATFATLVLARDHVVQVGKDNLGNPNERFYPPVVEAAAGDTITFRFYHETHTVTQGIENKPCEYMPGGFFSGKVTTKAMNRVNSEVEFVITINNTDTIWYYCSFYGHCGYGMVGIINGHPGDYRKFQQQSFQYPVVEAQYPPRQAIGGIVRAPKTASSTSVQSSPPSGAPTGLGSMETEVPGSKSNVGAIAGGVVGGVVGLVLFMGLGFYLGRRSKNRAGHGFSSELAADPETRQKQEVPINPVELRVPDTPHEMPNSTRSPIQEG